MWVTFCLLTLGLPLGAYFKVDSVWDRVEESFEGKQCGKGSIFRKEGDLH